MDQSANKEVGFSCQQSGMCCSHLRSMSTLDPEIKELGYGKLPLVNLIPPEKITFPLWDFEAKRFRELSKEKNIPLSIVPLRALFDLDEELVIIVNYCIDSDACPFMANDHSCQIYNSKRAFICRQFPFHHSPFIQTGEGYSAKSMLGTCPSLKKEIENYSSQSLQELLKHFEKSFPDKSFLHAISHDELTTFANSTIIRLMREKKIRPAMNYPYEFLLKRMNHAPKIDFFDYLLKKNIKTPVDLSTYIDELESGDRANRIIKEHQ